MAKSGAQTLTFKSVTDGQTDRHTDRQTDRQKTHKNHKPSLYNGINTVSVVERLRGEIGRTNSGVQKRDEQANRQTDRQSGRQNLNVFGRPGAGEIRAPPNLAW